MYFRVVYNFKSLLSRVLGWSVCSKLPDTALRPESTAASISVKVTTQKVKRRSQQNKRKEREKEGGKKIK